MTDRSNSGTAGVVRAYLTLTAGHAADLGTLKLLLNARAAPRTVANFATLLSRPAPRGYRGCSFHRLIRGFMIQGGDFTNGDGTGGVSIYGRTFEDENFALGHEGRGTLSMANSGPDTNGSQFFITFKAAPHLDGRHVVFGAVDAADGESAAVLDKLEGLRTGGDDRPLVEVRIADCGVIEGAARAEDGANAAAGVDEDEIDLDDDGGEADGSDAPRKPTDDGGGGGDPNPVEEDEDEIDLDEDEVDNPSAPAAPAAPENKKLSKKAALQARLRLLKTRMNQSRALNRREVRSEGERLGSDEGMKREKRRLKREERERRGKEWEEMNGRALEGAAAGAAGVLKEGEEKFMAESADASLRKAQKKAEKARTNRFEANDYYNPEGQHRNYERGLKSLPPPSAASAEASTYDPLCPGRPTSSSLAAERSGAARLASELRRRQEKSAARKRDRDVEFDAADVSGINQRNKRFNEKIGRNFDRHTAEIRQNLERGTAL